MTTASIANWAVESGHHLGLFADGYLPQGLRWVRILPAAGTSQLASVLEALAKIFPTPVMPIGDLMQLEASALPWGTTAVVVTAVTDDPLRVGLARLADAGHATGVILIGDEGAPPDMAGGTYCVPEARGWRGLPGLVAPASRRGAGGRLACPRPPRAAGGGPRW